MQGGFDVELVVGDRTADSQVWQSHHAVQGANLGAEVVGEGVGVREGGQAGQQAAVGRGSRGQVRGDGDGRRVDAVAADGPQGVVRGDDQRVEQYVCSGGEQFGAQSRRVT